MKIAGELAIMHTKFHFNPALSPWMGGIWERGIGSIKHHLKRTVGSKILNYEELTAILIQIEAILNSRPLTPLNDNPDELESLTPGHFLVGGALTAPAEPDLLHVKENRLGRWELCVRLKQEFWKKWSNEYMAQLHKRSKWNEATENIEIGDMVLVKEGNTAPLFWPLGRITKIYRGNDGLVRVAKVLMRGKEFKRPIVKIALLPNMQKEETDEFEDEEIHLVTPCEVEATKKSSIENITTNKSQQKTKQAERNSGKRTMQKKNKQKTSASSCNDCDLNDKYNEKTYEVRLRSHLRSDRKKSAPLTYCMLAVTIFMSTMVSNAKAKSFEMINFNNNTHVCLNNCGTGMLITGEWNLVSHMDLHEYDLNLLTHLGTMWHVWSHIANEITPNCVRKQ